MEAKVDSAFENAEIFYCSKCGAIMGFDPKTQSFSCPNCGHAEELGADDSSVSELDFSSAIEYDTSDWDEGVQTLKCDACGAQIIIDAKETTATCSFCGSSHVLIDKQSAGMCPGAIIPFALDDNQAKSCFVKWIKGKIFAPSSLKRLFQHGKFMPVYLPYWTYDADAMADYTAMGGKEYNVVVGSGDNKRVQTRVRWYPTSGRISNFFDDVLVSAESYTDACVDKVDVFNTSTCLPFDFKYLSGCKALKYTRGVRDAFNGAVDYMNRTLQTMATAEVLSRYDRISGLKIRSNFSNVKYKHLLVPVWLSSYHFAGKEYKIAINGQTGRVGGLYPKSKLKIAIAVVLGIAVLAAIVWFFCNN